MQSITMKQLLLLIAAALGVWLFVSLADIMLPFIAGFVVAYLLDPLVDKLENIGLPRLLSSSLVMGTFMLLIIILFTLGLPVIAEGIQEAIAALQEQYAKFKLWFAGVEDTYLKDNEDIHNTIKEFSSTAVDNIAAVGQGVLLRGLSFLNILTLIFITPIVSFYLLNDWDRMIEQINDILPPKHATAIREVAGEVEEVLDGFIHGQATICVFLAIFYAAGLYWVGLNGGIAVGVLAGLVSFIPYVGALFGGVLAGLLGLMQFWPDITSLLLIAMVFAVGQFIEGNFLTPRLIGGRVRLHPVWIMFALLAFGSLLGFIGLLLAVPAAAVIGVLVRYTIRSYQSENQTDSASPAGQD